jgi:hypothetical protein
VGGVQLQVGSREEIYREGAKTRRNTKKKGRIALLLLSSNSIFLFVFPSRLRAFAVRKSPVGPWLGLVLILLSLPVPQRQREKTECLPCRQLKFLP